MDTESLNIQASLFHFPFLFLYLSLLRTSIAWPAASLICK